MKKLLTILAVTTLGLSIVPMSVCAADEKPKAAAREGRQNRLEMMKESLSLTPEQVEKIKPLLEADQATMKELRADTSLTQEARREKRNEMMKASNEKIKPILTPEQQEKWKEQLAKRRTRAGNADKN
jgi:Spy/CpxP family protein refolding chaperone